MKTLKELKALITVEVIRTVIKGWTIEDMAKLRKKLQLDADKHDVKLIETDDKFSIEGTTRFMLKPVQPKEIKGIIKFLSGDVVFTRDGNKRSYGDMPKKADLILNENGHILGWRKFYSESNEIHYLLTEAI